MLAEAARQPKRLLSRLPKNLEHRATREVVGRAVVRFGRSGGEGAAAALDGPLAARLPEADLKSLWGRVGHEAAREHYDKALAWYAGAGDLRLTDEQLAWKARAALRRGNWQVVRDSIDQMSAGARQERAWSYWYGRALAAQGEETGSRAYYLRVAGRPDFYGLLAEEELGYMVALPDKIYLPGEDEVAAAKRDPGIARALELRSEEHTSELQSQSNLVCRLLLEKKKKNKPQVDRRDKGRQKSYIESHYNNHPIIHQRLPTNDTHLPRWSRHADYSHTPFDLAAHG